MSVLFFWRGDNYLADIAAGKAYHLNQDSRLIPSLKQGDHVFAFTRREDNAYVLAADLVVTRTRINQPGDSGYEYGLYKAEGDTVRSRYFDTGQGPDAEPVIRHLSFKPRTLGLGSSFQGRNGVRLLTPSDEQALVVFSQGLPTI